MTRLQVVLLQVSDLVDASILPDVEGVSVSADGKCVTISCKDRMFKFQDIDHGLWQCNYMHVKFGGEELLAHDVDIKEALKEALAQAGDL